MYTCCVLINILTSAKTILNLSRATFVECYMLLPNRYPFNKKVTTRYLGNKVTKLKL